MDAFKDRHSAAAGRTDNPVDRFEPQLGDPEPTPFSFMTERIDRPQIQCHMAYTTEKTKRVYRTALHGLLYIAGRSKEWDRGIVLL